MAQFIACIGFIFILLIKSSQSETSTSKACYGPPGLPCTIHDLVCTRGSIAISEAYYTDNRDCGTAVSSCHVNVANVTETGDHHEFDETEMAFLYSNCSFKASCRYIASRGIISFQPKTFSVVKYKCVSDSFSACSSVEEYQMNSTSLFWNDSDTQTQCGCAISTLGDNINVSVYALDMRPNKTLLCSDVTISIHDQPLEFNCSSPILPHRLIAFTSLSGPTEVDFNVRESSFGGFIWIRVQGTHPFDLQCPAPVTSTVNVDVRTTTLPAISLTSVSSLTDTSRGTQVPAVMSSSSDGSVIHSSPTENSFPGGIFVAGVGSGATVVIIIAIVLYVLIIRRQYNITAKKQDNLPTPAPTYEGLSARDPTYDIIKKKDSTYVNSAFASSDTDNSRQYEDM